MNGRSQQARYWIGTIPFSSFTPCLPDGIAWIRGQHERGESGYDHWQIVFSFTEKKTLRTAKRLLGIDGAHIEPTRSLAAREYVWKEDTRVGEQFEYGVEVTNRNSKVDWDRIRVLASTGKFEDIPSDIFIRYYGNLRRIHADSIQPVAMERKIHVFWGPTGTGKSRRAWELGGMDAYAKDPRSKFWCGYTGQRRVVIDEFRGGIDIAHILRWFDRYPVRVEIKGGSTPLIADLIYVTSNLHPADWFPMLDLASSSALMRRLEVQHFS